MMNPMPLATLLEHRQVVTHPNLPRKTSPDLLVDLVLLDLTVHQSSQFPTVGPGRLDLAVHRSRQNVAQDKRVQTVPQARAVSLDSLDRVVMSTGGFQSPYQSTQKLRPFQPLTLKLKPSILRLQPLILKLPSSTLWMSSRLHR